VVVQNATVGRIDVVAPGASITVGDGAIVASVVLNPNASGTTLNVQGTVNTVETSAANTVVAGTGKVGTVTAKVGADDTAVTTSNTRVTNAGASGVTAGGGKEVPQSGTVTNNSQGTDIVIPPVGGGSGGAPVIPADQKAKADFLATLTAEADKITVAGVKIADEDITVTFSSDAKVTDIYQAASELLAVFRAELNEASLTITLAGGAKAQTFNLKEEGVVESVALFLLDGMSPAEFLAQREPITATYTAAATDKYEVAFGLAGDLTFSVEVA
jgi:hypothetical protein